jgi:hypothetical protein
MIPAELAAMSVESSFRHVHALMNLRASLCSFEKSTDAIGKGRSLR